MYRRVETSTRVICLSVNCFNLDIFIYFHVVQKTADHVCIVMWLYKIQQTVYQYFSVDIILWDQRQTVINKLLSNCRKYYAHNVYQLFNAIFQI